MNWNIWGAFDSISMGTEKIFEENLGKDWKKKTIIFMY